MTDTYVPDDGGPFESASALREAHTTLLTALDRELGGDSSEAAETEALKRLETQILWFLERGAATGAHIEETKTRADCQLLLNFWLSSLSQAGLPAHGFRLAKFNIEDLPVLDDESCPYVGLDAFTSERFFFGREADIRELLAKVRTMQLVIVTGASGSGKSSLVMGGILPELEGKDQPKLRIIPPVVPGNAVLERLVMAVRQSLDGADNDPAQDVARLRRDPKHLLTLLGGGEARPTLIIIDQFEELFTLSDPAKREILIASLVHFLGANEAHRLILTVREEFKSNIVSLSPLDRYRSESAWYSMQPMGYAELKGAVEQPAMLVNLQFQPGIIDDLVRKVLGQPTALPLLQFTLGQLWKHRDRNRITWEVYNMVGDPLYSLKSSADNFYHGLTLETQNEVKRIFLELVRVDEFLEAYRQPVPKNTLLKAGIANTESVIDLLAANDYVRVTSNGIGDEEIIEVKHESLLRNWPLYIDWINEKRQKSQQRLHLSQCVNHWLDDGKPAAGLLTEWQFEELKNLTDLDSSEEEFIAESKKAIEDRQKRKIRLLVSCFAALLLLVSGFFAFDHFYWQERKQTWGALDILESMSPDEKRQYAENSLNRVAIYLWNKPDPDKSVSLRKLLNILQLADSKGLFDPDIYQVTEWAVWKEAIGLTDRKNHRTSVIDIAVAPDKKVNEKLLRKAWLEFMKTSRDNGIPIPETITVLPDNSGHNSFSLKIRTLQTAAPAREPKTGRAMKSDPADRFDDEVKRVAEPFESRPLKMVENERPLSADYDNSKILVMDLGLDPLLEELLQVKEHTLHAEIAFEDASGTRWWLVPHWTIPLWKAVGHNQIYPPETAIALEALRNLEDHPEWLFSDGLLLSALEYQSEITPNLVRSACEASGGPEFLFKAVSNNIRDWRSLSQMAYFLEMLAKPGTGSLSPDVQTKCRTKGLYGMRQRIGDNEKPEQFKDIGSVAWQTKSAIDESYKPVRPIRVNIAKNLIQSITSDGSSLNDQVIDNLKKLRDGISQRIGLVLPGVSFRVDGELLSNEIRIAIGNEDFTPPITIRTGEEVNDIMGILNEYMLHACHVWVNIEETVRMVDWLPSEVKKWLTNKYTSAELKFILRETLVSSGSKYNDWSPQETEVQVVPGATLSHLSWLMPSLAFWSQVCQADDYACLGQGLRNTQEALLDEKQHDTARVIGPVDSLKEGRFDEAEESFRNWLSHTDQETARRTFLQAYKNIWLRIEYSGIVKNCKPKPGQFKDHELMVWGKSDELSALLKTSSELLTKSENRVLELCLNSSQVLDGQDIPKVSQSINQKIIEASANETAWSSEDKYWLTYLSLKSHFISPEAENYSPPPHLAEIEKLFHEAVSELPLAEAEGAYLEVLGLCSGPDAGAWCMQMLRNTIDTRIESYWIPLEFAFISHALNRDYAHFALQLLDQAEKNINLIGQDRQRQQEAWISYIRGLTYQKLAELGETGALDKAIPYLEQAKTEQGLAKGGPGPDRIYSAIAGAWTDKGDFDKAGMVIEEGEQKTPAAERNQLRDEKFRLLVLLGHLDRAVAFTRERQEDSDRVNRCIVSSFTREQNEKALRKEMAILLSTAHQYTDYVRLVYYWRLMKDGKADEARQVLEKRWQQIDPSLWEDLLQADRGAGMRVWREKLIGYFLGKVGEVEICDDILDPMRFQTSGYHNLEVSREGFLSDWYFYDGLLQSVSGDPQTRRQRLSERLEKTIAANQPSYIEYIMARNMLQRISEGELFTLEEDTHASGNRP